MSHINIVHSHKLAPAQAREGAQRVAEKLSGEFDLACEWNGDVLHFQRSGVTGTLALAQEQVEMKLKLGMLMSAFSGPIEQKIRANMSKVFG